MFDKRNFFRGIAARVLMNSFAIANDFFRFFGLLNQKNSLFAERNGPLFGALYVIRGKHKKTEGFFLFASLPFQYPLFIQVKPLNPNIQETRARCVMSIFGTAES